MDVGESPRSKSKTLFICAETVIGQKQKTKREIGMARSNGRLFIINFILGKAQPGVNDINQANTSAQNDGEWGQAWVFRV